MTADDWYPWQLESFFSPVSQVMILAANRTGKTLSAGYQVALHMTGDYPDWWEGYRFTHAPNVLVSGVNNDQLKIVVQKELFGDITEPEGGGRKRFARETGSIKMKSAESSGINKPLIWLTPSKLSKSTGEPTVISKRTLHLKLVWERYPLPEPPKT